MVFLWRCPWCNGYRRRKWTRRHEFKSWTRLIAFHIALIPLGKVWIQLFSLQLWMNSRRDYSYNYSYVVFLWRCPWCNGYRRRIWTRRHEFKSWTRLIAFHIALIPLGKVWIKLFSLQLWMNSRTDYSYNYSYMVFLWRCPWCNGYRRRKWTRRHEFKSWTRLIAFHIALILLGKVWIQLFSLQLWMNSRTDYYYSFN